jgi:hypothetical protein
VSVGGWVELGMIYYALRKPQANLRSAMLLALASAITGSKKATMERLARARSGVEKQSFFMMMTVMI